MTPPGTARAPWIPLISLAGWVLASLLYRKIQGKPLVYRRLQGTRSRQTNASGYSHRSWLTRLGGANYGLEHRVALSDIRSVEVRKRIIRSYVEISFRSDRGGETVSLLLSKPEDFFRALGVSPAGIQPAGSARR